MHGEGRYYMDPKGHIVLDKFPGEWEAMPSYIEEPRRRRLQMGIDPRAQPREVQPADGVLDPDLHPSRDRLSAGHRRRQLSHGDAHRGRRRPSRPNGWRARIRRSSPSSAPATWPKARSPPATTFSPGTEVRIWSRSQATLDHFVKEQQPKYDSFEIKPSHRPRATSCAAPTWWSTLTPARGADRHGRLDRAGHAYRRGRRRQEGRPGARAASCSGARIFVDDIRQCRTDGEINVPLSEGLITEADIAGEIGEVITGKKKGRTLRRRDHHLRFHRHRAAGFGDRAARI